MKKIDVLESNNFGYNFIPKPFVHDGQDEYYFRFKQNKDTFRNWRNLTYEEVELLIKNGNTCRNWDSIFVEDPFNPEIIKNSLFAGLVRLSSLQELYLRFHDFVVPTGITNSKIISCDIGENCAIHDCVYISHYIIGNYCILNRVDEMSTTNHAKFGEGIVKEGEDESVRITIETINEVGGREIYPFVNMICADAFLWARYRDDSELMEKLHHITQNQTDARRGYYGEVCAQSVIKSCRIIKDVNFGEGCYVKGANKLKNLTIRSSAEESTQIGEGVELVNGIIGYGCHVFYGVKAVRFIIGNNCTLKYGARLIHSFLADNSTISCCEVLNALIFPYHEQHHNNSFLIASLIMGQSNMAAGATVGSNHNTRGNDGEIIAGRGFWPGLSSTLKHNCRFASFVIINKGNYPSELDIPFPFSLVIDNARDNRLEIMPAYYWLYNIYALERNNKKFKTRDKRKTKIQKIETENLAPDTVFEIIKSLSLLECTIEKGVKEAGLFFTTIKAFLKEPPQEALNLYVKIENIERSKRDVKILHPIEAWKAYREMLLWYGVKTLVYYFESSKKNLGVFKDIDASAVSFLWVNMGGQLMPEAKVDALRKKIVQDELKDWDAIHQEYEEIYKEYEWDRAVHAYAVLCLHEDVLALTSDIWNSLLDRAITIRKYIEKQIYLTKGKDYTNPFRDITYRNNDERNAVIGEVEKNPLIINSSEDTTSFIALCNKMRF